MIYFGCDYYPEQWKQWLEEGEARWETDARLMAAAGFNVVRLAEFSWGLLEPEPGCFDFNWLDRAIDVLQRYGLQVVLCTPTAAPPPWLTAAHPDMLQVTVTGRRQSAGTRRAICANHAAYRTRSQIITQELVRYYADHPAVIGWQTDNEFGCHDSACCYCPQCERAFRLWLQQKYGTLGELNRAWGGAFWGEIYADWEHIPAPSSSAAARNPSHLLDYYRFCSDAWRDFHEMEIALLRHHAPGHFVTHNLMGFSAQLNYYDLCRQLDFASWDNYHFHGATPATVAAAHDHMWGVLERNFWVIEQQAGQINWSVYNPLPAPGFVRLKTYQAIGHGADGLLYFRWRQALAGSEQYHSGLLDHAGRKTAGYTEAAQIGAELRRLAPVLAGTRPRPRVAILLDYDSRWALQLQPHNQFLRDDVAPDFALPNPATIVDDDAHGQHRTMTGRTWLLWPFAAPYIALWERNVPVALVAPESDLRNYEVVIAPCLNLVRPAAADNLRAFVRNGGALVLGPRTGFKDQSNRLFSTPQPGPLAELSGATVRCFDSLAPERTNALRWTHRLPDQRGTEIGLWAEVLDANGAEVLATYDSDWYAGEPAITRRKSTFAGERTGQTIYVGCLGGPPLYHCLLDWLLPQTNLAPLLAAPAGVEVCERVAEDGRRVLFVLNHTAHEYALSLAAPLTDLLTGTTAERALQLQPGQVVIFERTA